MIFNGVFVKGGEIIMADILLTPESLLNEYTNLLKNKAALDQVVNDIAKNIIGTLIEHWQGEAQQAFENSFNQKPGIFYIFIYNTKDSHLEIHEYKYRQK